MSRFILCLSYVWPSVFVHLKTVNQNENFIKVHSSKHHIMLSSSSFALERAVVALCCDYVPTGPTHPTLAQHLFTTGFVIPLRSLFTKRLLSVSRCTSGRQNKVLAGIDWPTLMQAASVGGRIRFWLALVGNSGASSQRWVTDHYLLQLEHVFGPAV